MFLIPAGPSCRPQHLPHLISVCFNMCLSCWSTCYVRIMAYCLPVEIVCRRGQCNDALWFQVSSEVSCIKTQLCGLVVTASRVLRGVYMSPDFLHRVRVCI